MSKRDKVLQHNSGLLKSISSVTRRYLSESVLCNRITSFHTGFCWLLGYNVLSLAIARYIFWYHSWHFSWMPMGLASNCVWLFIAVHLIIVPLGVLFYKSLNEIRKIMHHSPARPLMEFLKDLVKRYFTVRYIYKGIIAYCLLYVALICYANLKPAIPLLNENLYDNILFKMDRFILHFLSFGEAVKIPKTHGVAVFFDSIYFQIWTVLAITLAVTTRDRQEFWRFTVAACLAFGLSLPVSVLVPSLGPIFYKPELFSFIGNTRTEDIMRLLWADYLSWKSNPLDTSIFAYNGIVAMPSLHISIAYLSANTLAKYFPRIRRVLLGAVILVIVSTVYLGWHYISDGIVGILLGWLAYKISTRWFMQLAPAPKLGY